MGNIKKISTTFISVFSWRNFFEKKKTILSTSQADYYVIGCCAEGVPYSFMTRTYTFMHKLTYTRTHMHTILTALGLIHTQYSYAQYCDIAIKRYCDKKTFFCQNIVVAFQNLFKLQASMMIFYTNSSIH